MITCVFLPGLVSDAFVWRHIADALPEDMPVHIADLGTHDSIAAMASAVLDEVDGDLIGLGHSMGGRVAMEMARQAPARVKALVLANTGIGPLREGELEKRQRKIDLGNRDMKALAAEWLPPMVDEARLGDTALMEALTAMVLNAGSQVHDRQIRALIGRPDASRYLPAIDCPVLLLTGRQDRWSPVRQHEEMAALAPDAELQVIDHAGHFMPVEQPEATARAITSWLARRGFIRESSGGSVAAPVQAAPEGARR